MTTIKHYKTRKELTETQKILSNLLIMQDVSKALKEYKSKQGKTLKKLRKELTV